MSFSDLATADRRRLIYSYVDTLAQLHTLDYVALDLEDCGRPGNYYERQVSRWSRQYQETETQPIAQMRELIDWLQSAIPEQDRTVSVHGD